MMLRRERTILVTLEESCGVKVAVAGSKNPGIVQARAGFNEDSSTYRGACYTSDLSNVALCKRPARAITPRLARTLAISLNIAHDSKSHLPVRVFVALFNLG
jgi:hypothetical protein